MSLDSRRIEKVFSVMQGIAEAGDGLVRVGAIADVLRDECPCAGLAVEGRLHHAL